MKGRRKKIRGLILALATAAVLVPAASGKVAGDESSPQSSGYTPQALQAMNERWSRLADYYQHSYTPQALKAMSERYTKMAQSYQHAGSAGTGVSGSYGGLYPGSGAGLGSTVNGSTRPDDRDGLRGVGTDSTASDYVDRQLANLQASPGPTHGDDRAGVHGPGPVETPIVISSHGEGFDWRDAGIGASIALFAAALLAAALLATRRRAGLAV
jgi:hypothetical protein